MRIGIDMMGGEYAPGSTIRGSILAREALPDQIELFLFGDQDVIRRYSEEHQLDISRMNIVHTPNSVSMGDHPFKAFRENPDARPDVLYQYGTIGTIYSKLVHEIAEPKVALLNMGQEEEKGNMATRSAYQMMKDSLDFDFIGNFENFGVSTAKAVKNMLLHTVEVVEAGLVKRIKEELNR